MSIFNHFQHLKLSNDQELALKKLEEFISSPTQVFILKGYAGSGKTTILKGFVEYLDSLEKKFALMAPTGRAAKVLRDKTGHGKTIHSSIYNYEDLVSINKESEDEAEHSFHYYFPIRGIELENKIIIVDEASMISSKESINELFTFGTNILLDDLLTYASLKTTKNKIIFVGDPAQLPPVGDNNSWALQKSYFEKLQLSFDETEMKEVLRQGNNLILKNSGLIRNTLDQSKRSELKFEYDETCFIKTKPENIFEKFTNLFPKPEIGDGVVISYSNSQCFHNNNAIREKLFPGQVSIVPGDLILINNNNYHTYGVELFNGDIAKVVSISNEIIPQSAPVWCDEAGGKVKRIITLNFRKITIRIPNHPEDIDCNIIDSLLNSIDRDLSFNEMKALYINFLIRFNEEQKKNKEIGKLYYKVGSAEFKQALKSDLFFNALRVKFGYAITCHKAQGGEWDKVFVDYCGKVSLQTEPLRWCYTATTRGINTVFAINPPNFGRLAKFKFSQIGTIGTLPNDALIFDNTKLSPFHLPNHHKCKSSKYWEILEKLENTEYGIERIETIGYIERYTISKNDLLITIQANNRQSGHFVEKFSVINYVEKSIKQEVEQIFNEEFSSSVIFNYTPTKNILAELFSMVQDECSKLAIKITNVVEGDFCVNYYLVTDSICSYIIFYYNGKEQLSKAMPKSFNCQEDTKLVALIQNLEKYAN